MKILKIVLGSSVGLVVLVLAVIAIRVYFFPNHGKFTFVNKASEPVSRAAVTICGQSFEFKDLQPGQSSSGDYKVKCEGHYTIQVELRSGKKLQKETGYVTSGMNFQDEITATDSDVEITKSESK